MNTKQLLVCVLALLVWVSCVACSEPTTTPPSMEGFMIQPGLVMVTHPTKDSTVLAYAEQTTVNGFFASVTANEGFAVALLDASGTEVDDPNALVTDQMTFVVYEQGNSAHQVAFPLQKTDPVQIRRHFAGVAQ